MGVCSTPRIFIVHSWPRDGAPFAFVLNGLYADSASHSTQINGQIYGLWVYSPRYAS